MTTKPEKPELQPVVIEQLPVKPVDQLTALQEENRRLQETITAQKHLADAVEAKDKELSALKNKNEMLMKELDEAALKISNQKHLADAVEAKDKEISALKEKNEMLLTELDIASMKISNQKHLAEAVEAKDTEIAKSKNDFDAKLKVEVDRVIKIHEEAEKKQLETIQKLGDAEQRRCRELNQFIALHGNLLKSLQGSIDNAIALNDFMVEQVQKQ